MNETLKKPLTTGVRTIYIECPVCHKEQRRRARDWPFNRQMSKDRPESFLPNIHYAFSCKCGQKIEMIFPDIQIIELVQ